MLLSMPDKVTEGDLVSVRCSAESLPLSNMTLTKTSVDQSSVRSVTNQLDQTAQHNVLTFGFAATWEDAGVYTCTAANGEGSGSAQKTLEVACMSWFTREPAERMETRPFSDGVNFSGAKSGDTFS